jgi:hypothetical protein
MSRMYVKNYADGRMKIHMDDSDHYKLDDNGVDVILTPFQVEVIKRMVQP